MKKILFVLLVFVVALNAQQINYTWGQTTAGAYWNQTGSTLLDSSSTVSIVFDMQDYYWLDMLPLVNNDSAVVAANSNRMYFGTLWFRLDALNAADSTCFWIGAKAGNLIYHPNDGSRVNTTNINWSSTYTVIADTTRQKNDIQWRPYNVYLDFSGISNYKFLPPEFLEVDIKFGINAADSMAVYWNFAYPAIYEGVQQVRNTTRTNTAAKKRQATLH